jgi:hypothetical protein
MTDIPRWKFRPQTIATPESTPGCPNSITAMKPITTDDELAEHSRMLESDLDSLFKLVFTHRKPLAEGDIRLASVILRKWLTDGLLGHYCYVAGVVPTLEALDTTEICDAVAADPHVNYFLTAGESA